MRLGASAGSHPAVATPILSGMDDDTAPEQTVEPPPEASTLPLEWLLDSDPAVRWQVMRDLTHSSAEATAAVRARVLTEGWGARLLAARDPDGQWMGGACFPGRGVPPEDGSQPWTSTLPAMMELYDYGLDPTTETAREMTALVAANCRWEYNDLRFFEGEVEPCINGRTVVLGAYFGADVDDVVTRLLSDQLDDGGWNCWTEDGATVSSFASTICVLEGLLEYERAVGASAEVSAARSGGEQYLLARSLFRRKSTGEVPVDAWLQFSFPTRWYYDVLRGLEYFRRADLRDPRLGAAIDLARSKRQGDGSWLLENTHPGAVHFTLEGSDGGPSRWNTLRASRVLDWWDSGGRPHSA